jgi:hypothetical protein
MSGKLILGLLAFSLFLILLVSIILRKGRMPIKFAIVWYIPAIIIIILALVPDFFVFFAYIFGFQTISNLVIGVLFVLMILIIMALTILIAGLNTKINLLIQEISVLKKKVNDIEK